MARILRGDVLWADLEPARGREQKGRRPILVLSHGLFNDRTGTVIAMAITSKEPRAGFPLSAPLAVGMPKPSWVKIDQVRTLSTERLGRRIAHLPEDEVDRLVDGLLDIIA